MAVAGLPAGRNTDTAEQNHTVTPWLSRQLADTRLDRHGPPYRRPISAMGPFRPYTVRSGSKHVTGPAANVAPDTGRSRNGPPYRR
jgi:hypothetical protein